jgi:UDP:flavonoid glycosyltransferase YjiC (YdhE family)
MTEALYLHKPVFAVPIGQQFEQLINAVHIRSCGYGDYNPKPSAGDIRRFLKRIPAYRARLARYPRGDPNKEFFGMLDRMLQKMKRTR